MMWQVNLRYGIGLNTYYGITISENAEALLLSSCDLKWYLAKAHELLPWVFRFQIACWCWQGGETSQEVYDNATEELSSNPMLDELLSAFRECATQKSKSISLSRASSSKPCSGYVYLLRGQGYYKIGLTKNVDRRIGEISPTVPFETEIVCIIATDDIHGTEAELHNKFADKRVKGEWFELADEDVNYISALSNPNFLTSAI